MAGNIELGLDRSSGFTIDAEMKMGNIDLPKEMGDLAKDKTGLQASFSGKYGDGDGSISLEGKMGNVTIKFK